MKQLKDLEIERKEYRLYLLLLKNYALSNIDAQAFLSQFNLTDESEIIPYILNPENGYELAKYGYRTKNKRGFKGLYKIYTRIGNNDYQSCKTSYANTHIH